MLSEHKFRAERLELEITEGVFLADSDATDETFANLKALGVRLALDDFGTGYSSLGYLKKAPFDKIKIDQSFVRGAASKTSRNGAIIRAIVSLAESLEHGHHRRRRRNPRRPATDPRARVSARSRAISSAAAGDAAAALEYAASSTRRGRRFRLHPRTAPEADAPRDCRHQRPPEEIRLRNISAMGALVECDQPVAPGTQLTLDIVGVGPVVGTCPLGPGRAASACSSTRPFDLARLAPRREKSNDVTMLQPWYVGKTVGE